MLILTPAVPEALNEVPSPENVPSLEDIRELISHIWENAGQRNFTANISVDLAHDADGNAYENFCSTVAGRFQRGDVRYIVTHAGIAIHLDALHYVMVEVHGMISSR